MRSQFRTLFVLLASASLSGAQVPQMINYQGRVTVGGTNFDGTGQFKFSLIEGSTTNTLWSNDGTGSSGAPPSASVSLPVQKGLYSVLLGDATLSNMTAISSAVFTNSDVRLRVWFSDGAHGLQQLSPDQRIAAVGYAMMAGTAQTVPDGSITSAKIAPGAVGSIHIGAGAIGAANIATGSITGPLLAPAATVSNLSASGQSAVPGGGVILSSNPSDGNLATAGYVRLGKVTFQGNPWTWNQLASGLLSARNTHTAVWTGDKMVVWGGGNDSTAFNDGGWYDPAADSWTATTTNGAPAARGAHTAIWTGDRVIVWGGHSSGPHNDGGRYNPTIDAWMAVTTNGAPSGRYYHTAVWTGNAMIIWGGGGSGGAVNTGGRYDPVADSWTATSTNGAPSKRWGHAALWTGKKMVVWGGYRGSGSWLNDGGRYDPSTDSWTTMATSGAPSARQLNDSGNTVVWSGSEMIIWGGATDGGALNDGGRYDPVADSWTAIPNTLPNTPAARERNTAVWTGTEMIVWGGNNDGSFDIDTGSRYNPAANCWTPIPNTLQNTPSGRATHTAVWTGTEMIVFGGRNNDRFFGDAYSYTPSRVMYLYQRP